MTSSTPARSSRALVTAAALSALTASPVAAESDGSEPWPLPDCSVVEGGGNVTYSPDGGTTLTPTTGAPEPRSTGGVVALQRRGTLVGMVDSGFSISTDSGCTWSAVAAVDGLTQYELVAGPRDIAYAFATNYQPIYRVTPDGAHVIQGPVEGDGITGFWVHPLRDRLIRAVDGQGSVFESTDAGTTWTQIGALPEPEWVYDAAFSADGQSIIIGTSSEGAWRSTDGGATWIQSAGLDRTNVFEVEFGNDPSIVWSQEYHTSESGNIARKVSLSVDGGQSFTQQLDGEQIWLTNGVLMAPDPVDPDVVWIEYGTYFAGYGTDLYRYDAGSGDLTVNHHQVQGISSIDFHPTDPGLLYLGVTRVR